MLFIDYQSATKHPPYDSHTFWI